MRRTPLIPVAVAAVSLLATAFAPAAHAAEPEVVVDGLVSALSVAVADDGTVYASQNFASLITKVAPGGEPEVIFADEGHREIGGLSVAGDVLTFTATSMGGPAQARVYTLTPDDEGLAQTPIANTWAFEKAENPDGKTKYGVFGLSKSCKNGHAEGHAQVRPPARRDHGVAPVRHRDRRRHDVRRRRRRERDLRGRRVRHQHRRRAPAREGHGHQEDPQGHGPAQVHAGQGLQGRAGPDRRRGRPRRQPLRHDPGRRPRRVDAGRRALPRDRPTAR